jgi:hypothetical protein
MIYTEIKVGEVYLFVGTEFSPRGVIKVLSKKNEKVNMRYLDPLKKFGPTKAKTADIHPKWIKKPT